MQEHSVIRIVAASVVIGAIALLSWAFAQTNLWMGQLVLALALCSVGVLGILRRRMRP